MTARLPPGDPPSRAVLCFIVASCLGECSNNRRRALYDYQCAFTEKPVTTPHLFSRRTTSRKANDPMDRLLASASGASDVSGSAVGPFRRRLPARDRGWHGRRRELW